MEGIDFAALLAVFVFGLTASISHCIGMCGGIVLSYTATKTTANNPYYMQALAHFLYNFGRIGAYVSLGAIAGYLGSFFTISPRVSGLFFILVGVLIILVSVFFMLGKNIRAKINLFGSGTKKLFGWLFLSPSILSYVGIGFLNGLIPCGMVYGVLLGSMVSDGVGAVASGAVGGALLMLSFGLGTFTTMFLLGFVSSNLITSSYRRFFLTLSVIIMVSFGGYTIYKGYNKLTGKANSHMMKMQMQKSKPMEFMSKDIAPMQEMPTNHTNGDTSSKEPEVLKSAPLDL